MIGFFILGLIIHVAAMALPAVQRHDGQLNRAVNLLNTVALVLGLIFSVHSLLTFQLWDTRFPLPFVGTIHLACDGITLFFLFTFQLLSVAGSVYAIGYLEHYVKGGVNIRWHLVSFTLLILSLQLILVVQHALVFLTAWELMAVSAYFCIVLEKDKPEVRRGGFWYFVATHASALFLYLFFVVLHDRTGAGTSRISQAKPDGIRAPWRCCSSRASSGSQSRPVSCPFTPGCPTRTRLRPRTFRDCFRQSTSR